jgi:hypothetical protein
MLCLSVVIVLNMNFEHLNVGFLARIAAPNVNIPQFLKARGVIVATPPFHISLSSMKRGRRSLWKQA